MIFLRFVTNYCVNLDITACRNERGELVHVPVFVWRYMCLFLLDSMALEVLSMDWTDFWLYPDTVVSINLLLGHKVLVMFSL
jgi:hypothetical protein